MLNKKNLLAAICIASVLPGAIAAQAVGEKNDAIFIASDGRVLTGTGVPAELNIQSINLRTGDSDPIFKPHTIPASCKAFDMAAYQRTSTTVGPIPGVPYSTKLINAWHEASSVVGATPDSIFFCMTKDGTKITHQKSTTFNPKYDYRKAINARPEQGQIVSFVDGELLIGVVFWDRTQKPQSQYLSMNFGK